MAFSWKILTEEKYLERAVEVETRAMHRGPYLSDAWNYYQNCDGALVGIFDNDLLVGIGRISVMPDKIGWLECLRVHPDYQGMDAGKLIYKAWLEIAKKYNCRGMAMFTSTDNATSSGLAEKYGLFTTSEHQVYRAKDFDSEYIGNFSQVNWQRAVELITPLKEEYGDYMTTNRTFYRINTENAKAFADMGFVFEDSTNGDFIVIGSRFQHYRSLNIIAMGGDIKRCTDFAKHYAKLIGVNALTCTATAKNEKLRCELENNGFEKSGPVFITKEIIF